MKDLAVIPFKFSKGKLCEPFTRKIPPLHNVFQRGGCDKAYSHSLFD